MLLPSFCQFPCWCPSPSALESILSELGNIIPQHLKVFFKSLDQDLDGLDKVGRA